MCDNSLHHKQEKVQFYKGNKLNYPLLCTRIIYKLIIRT